MWLDLGDYRGPSHFHAIVMYMVQRRRMREVELAYRIFVTDALRNIPQAKYSTERWFDMLKPHEDIDVDDIIDHVVMRISEER